MAEARRKTTIEERKEIIDYCIKYDLIIKKQQAFMMSHTDRYISGFKKYHAYGEGGLTDKCGHHKTDEEVNDSNASAGKMPD